MKITSEVLVFAGAFVGLAVAHWLAGLPDWSILILGIGLWLAFMEWWMVSHYGITLSEHWGRMARENEYKGWTMWLLLLTAFLALLIHLLAMR